MKILKFKTNINCGDCVNKVTPFLDREDSISKWQVDTQSKGKILSVSGEELDPQKVINAVEKAGFKAEMERVLGIGGEEI